MFEQKLIEEIVEAWELDQKHPNRDRKKKPIPSIRDVKEILEQSFLASLKREEEKPISFYLAHLDKNNVEIEAEQTGHKQLVITFENQIPFTVEGISKIAPAFDPDISALIIARDANNDDKFFIWGAMFFGPSLNRFTEIPYIPSEHNFSRPDVFMISTMSTGSLIISRGNSQIGSFSSGVFISAIPTPFIERGLGRYLIKNIQEMEGYTCFRNLFWQVYRDALE